MSRTGDDMGSGPQLLRLDQPSPDGVPRELDAVAHAELAHQVLPVPLDRLATDGQQLRYLIVGMCLGDQLEDFELTGREWVRGRGVARARALEKVAHER